jgi:hypothetical protein
MILLTTKTGEDEMKPITIAALLFLGTAALPAHATEPGRDMTCDGPYRGERVGYCHLMDGPLVGIEIVEKTCEMYHRCVIRARVIPDEGKVDGRYQNYTVLKVYSARRGK